MVNLFYDLEKLPRTHEPSEVRKDVCLGFCYDPLSAQNKEQRGLGNFWRRKMPNPGNPGVSFKYLGRYRYD